MKGFVAATSGNPALTRFGKLFPMDDRDSAALSEAAFHTRRIAPRSEVLSEGEPIRSPSIVLAGWACRIRELKDGRRQILGFMLPGELIGVVRHPGSRALSTVIAATELILCPAPAAPAGSGLAEAYAVSAMLEEGSLLRQITRLGRLSALERTADLLLELHDRLLLSGTAQPQSFSLPVTQETLADALGLTSVHVNRTLQAMRGDGLMVMSGGQVSLPDRTRLALLVDYHPPEIAAPSKGHVRSAPGFPAQ